MKAVRFCVIIGVALAGVLRVENPSAQQDRPAEVLLGTALHQEQVEGNLEAAIETYKKVVALYAKNRPVAAKALLQMGQCYDRLGKDGARRAYEQLVRDYADQSEAAAEARTRLAALRRPASASGEAVFATRQVWTPPDMGNTEGAASPDGRYLSFTDWDTGDLAIHDLEDGSNRRLTNKGPWDKSDEYALFSRWSPDGRQIAYDWYAGGGKGFDLRVIGSRGGEARVLVAYGKAAWLQTSDWSPDGRQILVFLEREDGTRQIVLVSATDGSTRIAKTFERREYFPQQMGFSRDGRYIAYDQPQDENVREHDIFLIPADGSQEVPLVKHPAHDFLLGWPPGGKGILFASDRTGSLDVWFLAVSGGRPQGAPELVKGGVEEIVPMGFSRDGAFYYAQGQGMYDVYVARLDPGSARVLEPPEKAITRFEGRNSWPAYSPDGRYLAFVTTRSRAFQAAATPNILSLRSLETGNEREFPTKFRRLAGTRWSPDGRSLYLAAWDNRGMGIYRVDAQTGEFTSLVRTEPPAELRRHEISADGNLLLYGRRVQAAFEILSRDLKTGEERQIYAGDEAMFSISPDGRWLALISQGKTRALLVMPVSGGERRVLLRFEEARSYFGTIEWTEDGKHILLPRLRPEKDTGQFALWRVPVEGGEPEQLNLVMRAFQELSAHPDGQHLAFDSPGSTLKMPSIWVMENYLPPVRKPR